MKVKLVYRNYKPLHSMYTSIVNFPPPGVEISAPKLNTLLVKLPVLFKIYRKFGRISFVQKLTKLVDGLLFSNVKDDDTDVYHYINIAPEESPKKPYIVEFEHAGGLLSFVFDKRREADVKKALLRPDCKAIVCSSQAARKTLKQLLKSDYRRVKAKTHIVYPALDRQVNNFKKRRDIAQAKKLRLLFVGNDSYRKGLEEILVALTKLSPKLQKQLQLTVISNDADIVLSKYSSLSDAVKLLPPAYSKQAIIEEFYSKSDVFLLPTKQDTFGFAILDALSSGTPVISTKQFAIPEIVTDQVDGTVLELSRSVLDESVYFSQELADQVNQSNIDQRLVESLAKLFTNLCQDKKVLVAQSQKAFEKFKPGGRFHIGTRNKQRAAIYKTAIAASSK
ncbi:MAG: glycosyltransferase family 4 protein [Candidatus Saccharimonadales bacterium]